MKGRLFFFITISVAFNFGVMSDNLETLTIEEGKVILEPLLNLTDMIIKKHQLKECSETKIKIYPLSESNLYPFRIQSNDLLMQSSPIDRESVCSNAPPLSVSQVCARDICCRLLGFQYKCKSNLLTFFVLVKIIDVNDQEPKFKPVRHPYMKLLENVEESFQIDLPTAEDLDSQPYSVQRYSIAQILPVGEMTDFRFSMENIPKLIVSTSLDYERTNKYKFRLTAFDFPAESLRAGHSSSVIIEIDIEDINDNNPKFEKAIYNIEIKENETPERLLKWRVHDADSGKNGIIHVFFKEDIMSKRFQTTRMSNNEGYVGLTTSLDYEHDIPSFTIYLVAQDQGAPSRSSTAVVKIKLINVNDNAPKIQFKMLGQTTSNTISIKENIGSNSLVAEVRVTDDDNLIGSISCRLLDHTDLFFLDQPGQHNPFLDYKPYALKTVGTLDRESPLGSFIRIQVECSDGDIGQSMSTTESLNIQIEDVNDNPPIFVKSIFEGSVDENQINVNVHFASPIAATDADFGPNGKIEFSIEDLQNSTASTNFLCDKASGKITTQKLLDFESQKQYRFRVFAKNQGVEALAATATVVVNVLDVNDNPPIFPSTDYLFSVTEDAKTGTTVGAVTATDKDSTQGNKVIRYSMNPKDTEFFEVDRNSGEIKTRKSLDRESQDTIRFKIVASNPNPLISHDIKGIHSEVQIVITVKDINDNHPKFTLKPHCKPRVEFIIEQYVEGSTCAEIPYTVEDADLDGINGHQCCSVTLDNTFENLFSLMANMPSYICLMKRPTKYQSLTINLVANDHPNDLLKGLSSKISFQVLIKTDPNIKRTNNRPPEQIDPGEQGTPDTKNFVVIAILTTVVLVFLIIIIIIIIIIRRCSFGDQTGDYRSGKSEQNLTNDGIKGVRSNINCLIPEQSNILQPGKMMVTRGFVPSPHYSDTLQKTTCRSHHHSQSTASSPFTPPMYHQIMTNQGIRIVTNPRHANDQYLYEWPSGPEEHEQLMTVSRSVLNSSSEKGRPLSPARSESLHAQSKSVRNNEHDVGYQILNPFSSSSATQRHTKGYAPEDGTPYANNENRPMTLINNFFDEDQIEQSNKVTPMTIKRNYFQTTFV